MTSSIPVRRSPSIRHNVFGKSIHIETATKDGVFKVTTCFRFGTVLLAAAGVVAQANDWPRFRGPAGSGVASDFETLPDTWSPDANIAWKTELPGPGASSPIIVAGRVFVTCYSGYGVTKERESNLDDLVRHLVCVDLNSGKTLWQTETKASLPEDSYYESGVSSHGYASHTPCSDGSHVYCFFGKGGVHAFDMDGNELWQADAGKESDPPKWGSASSPVLYNDTLIVTASAESQSIICYDKATGDVRWRQEAAGLDGMWGTPKLVKVNDNRTDLVMLVAEEVWGLDPDNGKLRWYAQATTSQQAYTSIVSQKERVFAFSGQGGGSVALDAGGSGDVSETNIAWNSPVNATYASPVCHNSRLYLISRGVLSVLDAKNGDRLNQIRLKGARITGNARFGSLDYASPVIAGNRLYYLNASGQTFVFDIADQARFLSTNEVTNDKEAFWGSPALSSGRMILRSSKHLYCITDKGEEADRRPVPAASGAATDSPRSREPANENRAQRYRRDRTSGSKGKKETAKRPLRPQRPESAVE